MSDTGFEQDGDTRDADVEGDMILGDLEAEVGATDTDASIASLTFNSKPRHNERAIRQEAERKRRWVSTPSVVGGLIVGSSPSRAVLGATLCVPEKLSGFAATLFTCKDVTICS